MKNKFNTNMIIKSIQRHLRLIKINIPALAVRKYGLKLRISENGTEV